MSAIEIYTKIMDAVKDADAKDAYTALNFAQQEINNKYYSSQEAAKGLAYANQCATGSLGYPRDVNAEAVAMVRKIAREEINGNADKANTEEKEAA